MTSFSGAFQTTTAIHPATWLTGTPCGSLSARLRSFRHPRYRFRPSQSVALNCDEEHGSGLRLLPFAFPGTGSRNAYTSSQIKGAYSWFVGLHGTEERCCKSKGMKVLQPASLGKRAKQEQSFGALLVPEDASSFEAQVDHAADGALDGS